MPNIYGVPMPSPKSGVSSIFVRYDVQNFGNIVNNNTHLHPACPLFDENDNDAGSGCVLDNGQAELCPQTEHGNYFATQIDYASHMVRTLRYGGDLLQTHNLTHLQDLNPIFFLA